MSDIFSFDPISSAPISSSHFIKDPLAEVRFSDTAASSQVGGPQAFEQILTQCSEKLEAIHQQASLSVEPATSLSAGDLGVQGVKNDMEIAQQLFSAMNEVSATLKNAYEEFKKNHS